MRTAAQRVAARWLRRIAYGKPDDGVVYTGVFLTPMDRKTLLRRFPPIYADVVADHMTMWFFEDGGDSGLDKLPVGKTVPLKVIGYAADDKAQAVILDPPTKLRPHAGRRAHITISVSPGTPHVYSNTLISKRWDDEEARGGLPTLKGRIGWSDGTKTYYDRP